MTSALSKQGGQPAAPTIPKLRAKQLNPAAVEFLSSRSESEASSVDGAPSGGSSGGDQDTTKASVHLQAGIRGHRRSRSHDSRHMQQASGQTFGWESPQGVVQDVAAAEASRAQDSPPPIHPQMMAPYPPHHYAPSPYPVYHVYHPAEAAGGGTDRSASPAAIYPTGGSPPLGPGFISVPVGHRMDGGSPPAHPGGMMYGPSPGSSPPGAPHFLYLHPHHQHGHHHPHGHSPPPGMEYSYQHPHSVAHYPHPQGSMDMAQHMASLALNQSNGPPSSSGGASGSSPTASASGRGETRASARIARSHRAGGAYNPSDFEFNLDEAERGGAGARTTVMVRNIPNKYNQSVMMEMLHDAGLKGTFDFFYLPIDFRNRCGLGYAFVNFVTPVAAAAAYKHFHNRRWDEFNSKKVCEVTYGRVQGRDALVQHFKAAKFPSSDAEYQPLVFSRGGDHNGEEAHSPLPIHKFLEVAEAAAAVAEGAKEAAESSKEEEGETEKAG